MARVTAISHGPSYSMRVLGSTSDAGTLGRRLRSYSLSQLIIGLMLYRMTCMYNQLAQVVIVSWSYNCIIVRRRICTFYCWSVAHQDCVPGPCFRALDWQHRLPGYAFDGLGDFWYFDLYIANCYILMIRLFICTLDIYLVMSTIVANLEIFLILSFILSQTCCGKSCLVLWINSCDSSLSFLGK